jgi:hypothetical protein
MRDSGTVTVVDVMEPFKVGTNEFSPTQADPSTRFDGGPCHLVAPFGTAECPYGGISFDRR